MPCQARLEIPSVPVHVTQRGVNRCAVFLNDNDRQRGRRKLSRALGSAFVVASVVQLFRSLCPPLAKLLGAVSAKMVVQANENDRNDQDNSADRFYLVARAQETFPAGLGEQKWRGGEKADGKADQAEPGIELYPFPYFMNHVCCARFEVVLESEALSNIVDRHWRRNGDP